MATDVTAFTITRSVPTREVRVELRLTGMSRLRVRIAAAIIRFAACVGGFTANVRTEEAIGVTADGIPRALSTSHLHRGYRDDATVIGAQIVVMLDGVQQHEVIAYDMDHGRVSKMVPFGSTFVMHHFKGVVTVEFGAGTKEQ